MRESMLLSLLLVGVLLAPSVVYGHHDCVHEKLSELGARLEGDGATVPQLHESVEKGKRRLTGGDFSGFDKMRIKLDLTRLAPGADDDYTCRPGDAAARKTVILSDSGAQHTCTTADEFTDEKRSYLMNTVIPEAAMFFEETLGVERVSTLQIAAGWQSTCEAYNAHFVCCRAQTPSAVSYPGYDFVLYVTARPTSGTTIAWALSCQYDQFGRPTSGQANFGPAQMKTEERFRHEQLRTAIHEISHSLGFSGRRFEYYRFPGNGAQRGYSNVVAQFTERGHTVTKIVTPKVVEKAQEHFGCTNWPNAGVEIEEWGGSGTAGSHWDKRVLMNEFMTGTSSANSVISSVTLALFYDMGWYSVDYSRAEYLTWGNNEGCGFVQSSCDTWPSRYFCNSVRGSGCSVDYLARSYCNRGTLSGAIPSYFQYFGTADDGGSDNYADFCPYYRGYSNGDCRNMGASSSPELWYYGEEIGPRSRCFTGTYKKATAMIPVEEHAGCHSITCGVSGSGERTLTVKIGSSELVCPPEGGDLDNIPGYDGVVHCPPARLICATSGYCPNDCSARGTCLADASCACNPGYGGLDCSQMLCPSPNDAVCSDQGTCDYTTGVCDCYSAYSGLDCSAVRCDNDCNGNGDCDENTGECHCYTGFAGDDCSMTSCPGEDDGNACSNHGACVRANGACSCAFEPYPEPAITGDLFSGFDCSAVTGGVRESARYEDLPVIMGNQSIPITKADACARSTTGDLKDRKIVMNPKDTFYFNMDVDNSYDVTLNFSVCTGAIKVFASFSVDPPTASPSHHSWVGGTELSNPDHTILHLCGLLGKKGRGVGLTHCGSEDSDFVAYAPQGPLHVLVVALTDSSWAVRAFRDPCESLDCGRHGECTQGRCECTEGTNWGGPLCRDMSCPANCWWPHGDCEIDAATDNPLCNCHSPWAGDECSNLDPALAARTRVVPYDADFTPSGGTITDMVDLRNWTVASIEVGVSARVPRVLVASMEIPASDESDPILVVQQGDLPNWGSLTEQSHVDSDGWNQRKRTRRVIVDVAHGLRNGSWWVGVTNSAYARGPLPLSLSITQATNCPDEVNACSGHGTCRVTFSDTVELCTCDEGWWGDDCSRQLLPIGNAPIEGDVLEAGQWAYYYHQVNASSELKITLERTGSPASRLIVMLSKQPSVDPNPSARSHPWMLGDSDAVYFDFSAWESNSATHTIFLQEPDLRNGFYYVSVYNAIYAHAPSAYRLTVTKSTDKTPVWCETASSERAGACNYHGYCDLDAARPECLCDSAWVGPTCNTPRLGPLQKLQEAAQDITSLCNMCEYDVNMTAGSFKLYKIPQPLQAALVLTVTSANETTRNATSGVPDLYVSEQLPRSAFDFVYIGAVDGSNEELTISKPSDTGRYYMALYAGHPSGVVTYHLKASRKEIPGEPPMNDVFWDDLMTWIRANPVVVAVAGGMIFVLCCGGCWGICRSHSARKKTWRKLAAMRQSFRSMSFRRSGGTRAGVAIAQARATGPWACPACSLLNDSMHSSCASCGTERGHAGMDQPAGPKDWSSNPMTSVVEMASVRSGTTQAVV